MKTTQHWQLPFGFHEGRMRVELAPSPLSAFPEQFYSTGGKFTHLHQYFTERVV